MPVTLYPYQSEDQGLIDQFGGRVILGYAMGLGKTATSSFWALNHPDRQPILVVCPASVKYNWEFESKKFFGITPAICEGRQPPAYHSHGFGPPPSITIINYDVLKDWLGCLKRMKFKTVIFDEGQMLSHHTSKRRVAAKALIAGVPHVLILSGTPFMNKVIDLWSVVNLLWPEEFPSQWSFAQQYCSPRWTPWGWNLNGGTNLDELGRRLRKMGFIRRRKEDVLKDLPDKVYRIVPCSVDQEQYDEAANDFLGWLQKTMSHKVEKAAKAEKVTRIGYLIRLTARLKLQGPVEWANRFLTESSDTKEKLVIFAVHQKAIEAIHRNLDFKGVVINGEVSGRKRQAAIDQFNNDPDTRFVVANYLAGGVGTNLQSASEVALFEFPWRPGDIMQAIDRCHRIGQKKTVFVNFLVAGGTIEEDLARLHHLKQTQISTVLDGGADAGGDIDLYDELLRVLEGRLVR